MRIIIACAAVALGSIALHASTVPAESSDPETLRPASAFEGIKNKKARSVAMFQEVGKVIQHPRCLNCHPRTDSPTQTDAMTPHSPMVVRGKDGQGAPGLQCTTCHHEANFDPAHVPGAPHWGLAPREMAWQGETLGNICRQIKDTKRNGGKSMEQLIHHMSEDKLVGWGWHPGIGREPAPGTQAEFGALFKAWADSGAHCPA